ncbi:MAG: metal ABC transporter permease, partial [Schaalia georgiae]|nr:metal ABC transporter permease [Schaalia georgiae]
MLAILALPVLEAVVVGALAGLVGALAVLDRRVFFAESITHGTFPGAVLGVVVASVAGWGHGAMSLSLFAGALLMCLPLAALMYALTRIPGVSSQASAGVVLTLGFASGYFLATWFKPLPLQVSSFLAGSILTVSGADVAAAAACLALALGLMGACGPQLMRHCFDPVGLSPRARRTNELAILTVLLLTV